MKNWLNKEPTQGEVEALIRAFNSGQYAQALQISKAMTAAFPRNQLAWKCLGAVLSEIGKPQES